jgi:hypothetical protein
MRDILVTTIQLPLCVDSEGSLKAGFLAVYILHFKTFSQFSAGILKEDVSVGKRTEGMLPSPLLLWQFQ